MEESTSEQFTERGSRKFQAPYRKLEECLCSRGGPEHGATSVRPKEHMGFFHK